MRRRTGKISEGVFGEAVKFSKLKPLYGVLIILSASRAARTYSETVPLQLFWLTVKDERDNIAEAQSRRSSARRSRQSSGQSTEEPLSVNCLSHARRDVASEAYERNGSARSRKFLERLKQPERAENNAEAYVCHEYSCGSELCEIYQQLSNNTKRSSYDKCADT